MTIWNEIYNTITDSSINLVCMFIGCSMEYYNELTEENNQQYPCFLNKFNGRKLIILIDPYLELNLKIEQYFIQKGNPLFLINKVYVEDKPIIRVFKNNQVIVYALNESINYIKAPWFPDQEDPDIYKINTIINICVNKSDKTKLILQDFSGNDTTYFYGELLKTFNRNDILNNINMDVTQDEGGCFIKLNSDMVKLDRDGNFIQEKFINLSEIKNSENFNKIFKFRIDILLYPIAFYYSKLIESPDHELDIRNLYKIYIIALIYNIDFDISLKNPSYIVSKLLCLIDIMLKDIIFSKDLEDDFYDYIINIIHHRQQLYETLKILKFE